MKKMVIFGGGRWAKELLTLARLEKIAYIVEENLDAVEEVFRNSKEIHSLEYLATENKDNLVVIISDSKRYSDIAKKLNKIGLIENVHFFNGWKLDSNFYNIIDVNQEWIIDENTHNNIFENQAWEKRAKIMSEMIPDDVHTIMDLGCGDCKLRKYLPDNITYYGLDYCEREKGTFVCDMNNEELPKLKVDMYYLAGVLQYITDKPRLIHQMKNAKYILLSAYPVEQFIRLDGHLVDLASFYYQDFTNDELVNQMFEEGFVLVNSKYDYKEMNAHFYLFQKWESLIEEK